MATEELSRVANPAVRRGNCGAEGREGGDAGKVEIEEQRRGEGTKTGEDSEGIKYEADGGGGGRLVVGGVDEGAQW